jgi:hypothetical protein
MNLQHVRVKFFVDGELTVDLQDVINTFHGWVAEQSMDEMMIDVADYRHVPNGPSVVLVGLKADYVFDETGGRPGLLYSRKSEVNATSEEQVQAAIKAAADACARLEAAFEGLTFSRQEFEVTVNDRAIAPNTAENAAELTTIIGATLSSAFGISDFEADTTRDSRQLLGANIKLSSAIDLAAGS